MQPNLRTASNGMRVRAQGIAWFSAAVLAFPLAVLSQSESTGPHSSKTRSAVSYPETKRVDVVEEHFGVRIADPYRWLENDPGNDTQVLDWIAAQKQTTAAYLRNLPGRSAFRASLASLFDYDSVSAPYKRGSRYFYTRKSGLTNQPVLYVREGLKGPERVVIDPNHWSSDGADALAEWAVSNDGSRIAYAKQEGGSDWRTIKTLDVGTGKDLEDEVKWARFTSIAWMKDGSGFFYARYPEPKRGESAQASVANHALYFHRIGTHQTQDRLLFATPDQPNWLSFARLTDDGRYAAIISSANMSTGTLTVVDLASKDWKPRRLVDDLENAWSVVASIGTKLFLITNKGAQFSKIVTFDLADAKPAFKDFVPEGSAFLNDAHLVGDRFLVSYLLDVKTEVRRYRLDGTPDGTVQLPGIGSVENLQGEPEDSEAFFKFTSFNVPGTVYQYDVAQGTTNVWVEPNVRGDLKSIAVDQVFFNSRDGTRVPMFIIRRKDAVKPAPTLLFSYGAYSISLLPAYSPVLLSWVDRGGVVAVPNVRGGGEYGEAWHAAGMLQKKQNVFDDFIAAAQYLHTSETSTADGLVIYGDSAGGLLVGAAVNQRPDLFAAAMPDVGVMDMLRFTKFTGGQLWVGEFGDPANEAAFRNLYAYSPYHNVHPGKAYPAILATTADADDRVVPAHTFKYVAALQAADIGSKPHLVRIETRAGHGAGKPTDKIIEQTADVWAFAAYWSGLKVQPE
jgi:prolyl oligopeptidase